MTGFSKYQLMDEALPIPSHPDCEHGNGLPDASSRTEDSEEAMSPSEGDRSPRYNASTEEENLERKRKEVDSKSDAIFDRFMVTELSVTEEELIVAEALAFCDPIQYL